MSADPDTTASDPTSAGDTGASDAGTGELRAIGLVISRELREAFRRKAVWITAGLFLLASTALMVLPDVLGGDDDGPAERTVATTGAIPDSFADTVVVIARSVDIDLTLDGDALAAAFDVPATTDMAETTDSREAAGTADSTDTTDSKDTTVSREAAVTPDTTVSTDTVGEATDGGVAGSSSTDLATLLDDADVDALVRFDTDPVRIVVDNDDDQLLISVLRQSIQSTSTLEALGEAGLTDDQIAEAVTAPITDVEILDTERGGRQAVALGAAFALYVLLLLLAIQVANGVAIEKASRVSEVLLAIVSPRALLFGKAIGVGVIGVFTLAAGALPVVVRLLAGGSMPPGAGPTLAVSAMYSVLGIALYLCLAGALGALVARSEEVSSAVGPLTSILIVGYIAGQATSDNIVGLVLALFPLTSPVVMPARVALDESSIVEVAASIALLAAAVVIAVRLATTVYRRAIVRTGQRLKLTDVLRTP
ncbi:MAG: ABC transporter permease [Ilumatobacter sp.]|uniref:ABC transporter permease n=1 Tax=Ilumatobacter sp. TaxID=1967498 RepID=UPI00391A8F1D